MSPIAVWGWISLMFADPANPSLNYPSPATTEQESADIVADGDKLYVTVYMVELHDEFKGVRCLQTRLPRSSWLFSRVSGEYLHVAVGGWGRSILTIDSDGCSS